MNIKNRIHSFLFEGLNPLPIFFLRVGVGLIFLFNYLSRYNYFPEIFSWNGLGGARPTVPHIEYLSVYWTLYWVLIVSSLSLVIGLYTRSSLVISTAIHFFFFQAASVAFWGWGFAIFYFNYLLIFCDPGAIYSVDSYLAGNRAQNKSVAAWKIRSFQLVTSSIFLMATINRIGSESWYSGKALEWSVSNCLWGRLTFIDWSQFRPLLIFLNYYILVLEGLIGILVFVPKLHKYVLPQLFGLTLGIEATMMVGYWQHLMALGGTTFLSQNGCSKFFRFLNLKSFRVESKAPKLGDKIGVIIVLTIWILSIATGIPKNLVSPSFVRVQNLIELTIVEPLQINYFKNLKLFSDPKPLTNYCVVILGQIGDKSEIIYASELDDCALGKFRVFPDQIRTTLFSIFYQKLDQKNPHRYPYGIKHLGEFFCQDPLSKKKRAFETIHYGTFIHDHKPRFPTFSFDCGATEARDDTFREIIWLLNQNHAEYLANFQPLGYGVRAGINRWRSSRFGGRPLYRPFN